MFTAKKSWEKAEASCEEKEGNLVKIESKEENTFLLQEFLIIPDGKENIEAWTGLTDKEEEGKFVWTDGQTPSSACTKWADEQPNDEDGEQDCAEIANGVFWPGGEPQIGLWNDFQCDRELNYICEKGREEYDLSSWEGKSLNTVPKPLFLDEQFRIYIFLFS